MMGECKYSIQASSIHGLGVIATQCIARNETIGTVVTTTLNSVAITEHLGRYVNHSNNANSCLIWNSGSYELVAMRDITPNEEITGNYHDTPWFLEKPKRGFV